MDSFEDLDGDSCLYILTLLQGKDLVALSMTCRWLRTACMHLIFGRSLLCVSGPHNITDSESFVPMSLRSYVQYATTCIPLRFA